MKYFRVVVIIFTVLILSASCFLPKQPKQTNLSELPQDNGLCELCHLDFDYDSLTIDHLSEGITCAHCHGRSETHFHDETMMSSPDVLYGRSEVEALCNECHTSHENPEAVEDFRRQWAGKKWENGRTITIGSICTDCHGQHTISRR